MVYLLTLRLFARRRPSDHEYDLRIVQQLLEVSGCGSNSLLQLTNIAVIIQIIQIRRRRVTTLTILLILNYNE